MSSVLKDNFQNHSKILPTLNFYTAVYLCAQTLKQWVQTHSNLAHNALGFQYFFFFALFQVMEIFIWTSLPPLKTPLYWLPLSRMCTSGHPTGKAASAQSMGSVWRRETTFTTVNPQRQSPSWAALKPCWILRAFSTLTKHCQTIYTNSFMVFMIYMKNKAVFILPRCLPLSI